jgi:PAS domain-containing protein
MVNHEIVRVKKDGSLVNVTITAFQIRDATGELTGYAAISRDITEHKTAEEEQRLRTQELEALLNIANILGGGGRQLD